MERCGFCNKAVEEDSSYWKDDKLACRDCYEESDEVLKKQEREGDI